MTDRDVPLVIDVDGSLINTDLLQESFAQLCAENPVEAVKSLLAWRRAGLAAWKAYIAERVAFDPALLPYNRRVLDFARAEKAGGRAIVLASASNEKFIGGIAEHLGFVDSWMASSANRNLKAAVKAEALVEKFGVGGFDYVGDSRADLAVWRQSREAIVVDGASAVVAEVRRLGKDVREINEDGSRLRGLFRAMRLAHWSKNALLFLPIFSAHRWSDGDALVNACVAFLVFGLFASTGYLANDAMDLRHDRAHSTKASRPFAAGDISLAFGVAAALALLGTGAALALWISPVFLATATIYLTASVLYSVRVKRIVAADVVFLTGLYVFRAIAGGIATATPVSDWLLAFLLFFFLTLALVKRCVEIAKLAGGDRETLSGRGYRASDQPIVFSLAGASGCVSILVLALYINSESVLQLYARPHYLWLLCPLVLYWNIRVLILANRGELDDDPVTFALSDKVSLVILGLMVGIVLLGV